MSTDPIPFHLTRITYDHASFVVGSADVSLCRESLLRWISRLSSALSCMDTLRAAERAEAPFGPVPPGPDSTPNAASKYAPLRRAINHLRAMEANLKDAYDAHKRATTPPLSSEEGLREVSEWIVRATAGVRAAEGTLLSLLPPDSFVVTYGNAYCRRPNDGNLTTIRLGSIEISLQKESDQ